MKALTGDLLIQQGFKRLPVVSCRYFTTHRQNANVPCICPGYTAKYPYGYQQRQASYDFTSHAIIPVNYVVLDQQQAGYVVNHNSASPAAIFTL